MDFLDDTTRVDGDIEGGDNELENSFFALPPAPSSPASETLFLPEEESEDDLVEISKPTVSIKRPSPSPETVRPTKRRRTGTGVPSQPSTSSANVMKPVEPDPSRSVDYIYIGEFLVDGAYSLVSGMNAIRVGEQVSLTRNVQGDPMRAKSAPGKDAKGKGKQTTLMGFVSLPVKPVKGTKKVDYIVRFTSQSGSHLGRLPVSMAEPIAVLMDGLARFSGSVVEAPERIRTGDSVLLSLRAYLSSSAFHKPNLNTPDDKIQVLNEGSETATEKSLRERRSSILRLFELVGLKPRVAPPVVDLHPVKSVDDASNSQKDRTAKDKMSLKKEVVGEGEDAEEVEINEDEEVLQEADIEMIYKKYDFYFRFNECSTLLEELRSTIKIWRN
jgi:DNA repair protein RAD5